MDWDLNHYSALADSFQSEKRCGGAAGGGIPGAGAPASNPEWHLFWDVN